MLKKWLTVASNRLFESLMNQSRGLRVRHLVQGVNRVFRVSVPLISLASLIPPVSDVSLEI